MVYPSGMADEKTHPVIGSGNLVIGTPGRILVVLKADGQLEYGPDYTPDEAAVQFWEAMGRRRLGAEERILTLQHMEHLLARIGEADLEYERRMLETRDLEEGSPERQQSERMAELARVRLEMLVHQSIELGRGLAQGPYLNVPTDSN